jgi:hypothetical protein
MRHGDSMMAAFGASCAFMLNLAVAALVRWLMRL